MAELRGRLTFSRSLAPEGLPASSTDGSLRLDYAAPEGRTNVLLSEIELTNESSEVSLRLRDSTHRLTFDHTKQTRAVSLGGSVEDVATGNEFQFDTPVAFEYDWRTHPALGELVVDSGRSRARLSTLADTRRRAWFALGLDSDANGDYEEQAELRWDVLLGGDAELVFDELFGFVGGVRGFFVWPFGPQTEQQLYARAQIPQKDLPQSGTFHYEWYRNGRRLEVSFPDDILGARETTKGDVIEARLVLSADPNATRVASATIRNSAPYMGVWLSPEEADTTDDIVVKLEHLTDNDGDQVSLTREWRVNDVVVDGVTGNTLAAEHHSRGDRVTFTVLADDGEDVTEYSRTVIIGDAPPQLSAEVPATVAHSGEVSFEVSINDPDGDSVAPGALQVDYGPPGMAIDTDGRVTIGAKMPLLDRSMDFHWQISSTDASAVPLRGTVTVVHEDGDYPMFRTRLQPPAKMYADDLDGDGVGEVLVLGRNGHSLARVGPHVLEWDGEEYVQSWAYPYPIGSGDFTSVAHADIDQDGHHEIFVAAVNYVGARSMPGSVARLDGKERRVAATGTLPTIDGEVSNCQDMAAGDLDGDGLWEVACFTEDGYVVVLSAHDFEVLWVAGSGAGRFHWESGVAIGNVDTDPALEIVTSAGSVFDGATRELEWRYEEEFSGRMVTLGDVNGDGVEEIIGDGVYSSGKGQLPFPAGTGSFFRPAQGTVVDANGDGRPELVWWDGNSELVAGVYQYDDLTREPELLYEVPLLPQVSNTVLDDYRQHPRLTHLAADDLDGDGREEMVFSGPGYYAVVGYDGAVEIEWAVAGVTSAEFRGGILDSGVPPSLLFIARNGEPEHARRGPCLSCGQAVMRLRVPQRGKRSLARTTVQPTGGAAMNQAGAITDIVATDVDGDGVAEIAVALLGRHAGEERSYIGTSLHSFDSRLNQWTPLPRLGQLGNNSRSREEHAPWRLALGDVNGDGRVDLLAGGSFGFEKYSREPHIIAFDLLDRSILFETDYILDYDGEHTASAIAGADLNGDGRAEIIVAAEYDDRDRAAADRLFVYSQSDADGEFVRTDHAVDLDTIYDIAVRDFDGDGEVEVVLFSGLDTIVRLDAGFKELNRFFLESEPHDPYHSNGVLTLDEGMDQVGRRTLLLVQSRYDEYHFVDSTRVTGIDVLTGKKIWTSPKLLGALRDISLVNDGERLRWAIATSSGMYVTR